MSLFYNVFSAGKDRGRAREDLFGERVVVSHKRHIESAHCVEHGSAWNINVHFKRVPMMSRDLINVGAHLYCLWWDAFHSSSSRSISPIVALISSLAPAMNSIIHFLVVRCQTHTLTHTYREVAAALASTWRV